MALFSLTDRSIFFKIYVGLLLVCGTVAFFSYLFINAINEFRLQTYREQMISGMFYLIEEESARIPVSARDYWLEESTQLIGDEFSLLSLADTKLKVRELNELSKGRAVVRQELKSHHFTVFHRTDNPETLISLKIGQISDRQVRAITVLLLHDLKNYTTIASKNVRLEELSQKLGVRLSLTTTNKLTLDGTQKERLKRKDMVLSYQDSTASRASTISVIAPVDDKGMVLLMGPVEMFHWFPANLLISTALIAMLLISLGVYALIYPLERRLNLLQIGVNQVSKGDLTTKVQVVGYDDIARLSVTFNKMIAQIRRLIESQRELTRAVSHELRTPVARIRFALDMLADEEDAKARQTQRQYIDEDIESLNKLIDEILTHAKLEEGSPKLEWEMVNLRALIEQIVRETKALGKPIEIKANLPNKKIQVMAERRYLHRVLQNFATNALRYAKSTIIISAGVEKGKAFVTVEDDGHGISEADREKVFVPFARLDDSRTRATGGYGLGLSIVSQIAFWFNGEAVVDESASLGGAKFSMYWPAKQVNVAILGDELTQAASEKKVIGDTL